MDILLTHFLKYEGIASHFAKSTLKMPSLLSACDGIVTYYYALIIENTVVAVLSSF